MKIMNFLKRKKVDDTGWNVCSKCMPKAERYVACTDLNEYTQYMVRKKDKSFDKACYIKVDGKICFKKTQMPEGVSVEVKDVFAWKKLPKEQEVELTADSDLFQDVKMETEESVEKMEREESDNFDDFPEFEEVEPEMPWELVTTTEKQAELLPEGWKWVMYDDGSGSIHSPDNKHYFGYDLGPYSNVGWIEYQKEYDSRWDIFQDDFKKFQEYAEKYILENVLEKVV